jgi:hypothetical protein
MNSRQINFYLTPSDQAHLEQVLRAAGDFMILADTTENGDLRFLDDTRIREMGREALKIHLIKPSEIGAIRFNNLPGPSRRVIDVVRSPVVEFDRCYCLNGQLRRGRLYAVTAFYAEGVLVRKHEPFVRWAGSLIAAARKALTKDPQSFFYFGEEALQLKEQGIELLD